jgi:hypothetical protein
VRQLLAAAAVVTVLALPAERAWAHDAYNDADSHPLKIMSYPIAVGGFLLEWIVARPIHFLVSQPTLQPVFNYQPTYNAFDTPEAYPAPPPSGASTANIPYAPPPPPAIYVPQSDEPLH